MATMNELKGRTKKAAGDMTGDKHLKREGQVDETGGKMKRGIDKATNKIKQAMDKKDS